MITGINIYGRSRAGSLIRAPTGIEITAAILRRWIDNLAFAARTSIT